MKKFTSFISEDTHPHKVHVRDWHLGSEEGGYNTSDEWDGDKFKHTVKRHEAEYDYSSDKGLGYKFKHHFQAKEFVADVNKHHRDLDASHD